MIEASESRCASAFEKKQTNPGLFMLANEFFFWPKLQTPFCVEHLSLVNKNLLPYMVLLSY